MRYIRLDDGLQVSFGHAALENEGLTTVALNIALDNDEYMDGKSIIDCIKERLMPNFDLAAITQELTIDEMDNLGGLVLNGFVNQYAHDAGSAVDVFEKSIFFLYEKDNASLGVLSLELGKRKLTYTL